MVFIGIVLLAGFLYIRDFKIPALLLFFFFITSGFNLVPEEITKFAFISKGGDFAFLILVEIIIIDSLYIRGYFKRDAFTNYLIVFALFLIICMLYSKFVVMLGWGDILRTVRYQFFWIAYFLFRSMSKEKLELLLKGLFFVTSFTALLFLLQIVFDKNILIQMEVGYVRLFGMKISRFYNQPDMLFFFTFMALYNNPLKGIPKYASMVILTAALLGAFHRSLIGCFLISVFIGFVISLPYLKRVYVFTISSVIILFIVVFLGNNFIRSRTYLDMQAVISGNIDAAEFDIEDIGNSTFTFRILHLLERNQYLLEHPVTIFLGAGLMPENSKLVDKMFDFKIGLVEELTGATFQLDTGDISYSALFLRLGYVGTFLYLSLIIYLMIFFYRKRANRYGFFSFLYLTLTIGVSFFSINLLQPVTFLLPLISYHIIRKTEVEIHVNKN